VSDVSYVIEGRMRPRLGRKLRELWAFKDTALAFTERNIRVQYKQAILGLAWAIIQPVTYIVLFTIAMGHLAKIPVPGTTYAAFALSVHVPWGFVQSSIAAGASSTVSNSGLMRKIYFPREVVVLAAVMSNGVDLGVGLLLAVIVAPILGAHITVWWLLLPLLVLILATLAVGIGLALSAFSVYYRDFGYVIPFALQAWLFASPVAYPLSLVQEKAPAVWYKLYVVLNPAAGILDSFTRVIAKGQAPNPALLLLSAVQAIVVTVGGYWVFKRLEPNFSDVV
jgi:lipopolysaccharide transport system permease protein